MTSGGDTRQVVYLCLQPTTAGQASHAHVHEVVRGLRVRGWAVTLLDAIEYGGASRRLLQRVAACVRTQVHLRHLPRPDVIYSRAHPLALPTALWARIRRIPMVHEVNGPTTDIVAAWPSLRPLHPIMHLLQRVQLRMAHAVVTPTSGLAAWVDEQTSGMTRTLVVPNGADASHFHPDASRPEGLPSRYVVFFGSLAPWQGIPTILEATTRPNWPKDVHLVIAGDGQMRDLVRGAVTDAPGLVHYLGNISYSDITGVVAGSLASLIVKEYERADLGLSPLKLYESMAAGVPVIATDIPGLGDVVRQSGSGIIVPAMDSEAVASAVAQLASDPDHAQQLGRQGRKAVLTQHTWEVRSGLIEELLTEVSDEP